MHTYMQTYMHHLIHLTTLLIFFLHIYMYNTDTHAAYIDCIYIYVYVHVHIYIYIYICAFCFLTHPANKNKQHTLRN